MRREYDIEELYEDVNCLHSVNTYIMSGLFNEPNTTEIKLQFKCRVNSYSSSHAIAVSVPTAGLQVYSNSGRMYNQGAWLRVTSGSVNEFETVTTLTKRTLKLIGGSNTSQTFTRSITDGEEIKLFGIYPDDIYYLKIYINGVLRRDYVPKKRLSDGVCGFFDLVENKFYSGDGEGYFTI